MPNALVTGGAGFIGSHLVRSLLADGFDVVVLDDLSSGSRDNLPEGVSLVVDSIENDKLVSDLIEQADKIFRLAAIKILDAISKLKSPIIAHEPARKGDIRTSIGSPDHAREAIGFIAETNLTDGLARYTESLIGEQLLDNSRTSAGGSPTRNMRAIR